MVKSNSQNKRFTKKYNEQAPKPLITFQSLKELDDEVQLQRSVKNLDNLYGKSEQLEQYYKDKEIIQKRDETKQELKMLLKKYVDDREHNTICAMRVGVAQKELNELHHKMDNAVK